MVCLVRSILLYTKTEREDAPLFVSVLLQQSSVCGAGLHSGVIDNDGGWLDVTRLGRKQLFTKSYKNGIQSIGYGTSLCDSFELK